jgi:protein TonB
MQADGFLSRRERHPVALTAAIGLNLAAVTAVLLAKGEAIPLPEKIIEVINIPIEKADPPPRPPVEPLKARTSARPRDPVDEPAIDDVAPILPSGGLVPGGLGGGGAVTGDPVPSDPPRPPEPIPVLTDAAPDPRFAALFQPPYPPQLERLDIEGKVVVKVLVGTDGRVRAVETVYADDDGFAAVTERQAKAKWRFKPATRDGVPVESWKQMTVRFQIRRG